MFGKKARKIKAQSAKIIKVQNDLMDERQKLIELRQRYNNKRVPTLDDALKDLADCVECEGGARFELVVDLPGPVYKKAKEFAQASLSNLPRHMCRRGLMYYGVFIGETAPQRARQPLNDIGQELG